MRVTFRSILFAVAIAAMFLAGILLRIGPHIDFSHVGEGNLSAYYFAKFKEVVEEGRLSPIDRWEFAPDLHPENVPPGLPYVAAGIFAIARLAAPRLTAIGFAHWFPVIIYALFSAIAFLLFLRRERSMFAAASVFAVISLAPLFASYTEYAYFVQEPLGALFVFLAAYSVANYRRSRLDTVGGVVSVAALALTWQQFPLFVFAALAVAGTALVMKRFGDAAAVAAILAAGIGLAEFVSHSVIGIPYSPVGMIKEIALGAWLFRIGDPDFLAAMTNRDWRRSSLDQFYRWYGPLTVFLAVWGTAVSWLRRRDFRYLASLVFAIAAAGFLWQFQKERIFGFSLLLFTVGMGALTFEKQK